MNTLAKLILGSFVLLQTFYLPMFIYFDKPWVLFDQWVLLQIFNLFIQPVLIGYSIYYLFSLRTGYSYWIILLLIINVLLYLLPIIITYKILF